MNKSLSRQFIAILLIPVVIILAANTYIISYVRKTQSANLTNYCNSTIDNVVINISALTTAVKRTATMFASKEETQSYLSGASTDTRQIQRQSFFDLISLSRSYTPDLVDILVWDGNAPTSMISYIPADMEQFAVRHFKNDLAGASSYFDFYIHPVTMQSFLIYFTPVFMTTYSEHFGDFLGNIAVICKSDTFNKLVRSSGDMVLGILNAESGQTLYTNGYQPSGSKSPDPVYYEDSQHVPGTNMSVRGTVYSGQARLFSDSQSDMLLLIAILSLLFVIYIAAAVHYIMIQPIHRLNNQIETIGYEYNKIRIETPLKNEIGSIASKVNALLARVTSLNQRDIASQARLYEMEISKKQTQLYAYQSQINPHFLYNMLQCMRGISMMHGIPEAAQICTNMADLFRYSIKGAFLVRLADELDIIDKYLYMIRIRFQNKITYRLETAETTKDCLIPKMILQPIVENAIFHGLESIEEDGMIIIRTSVRDEELLITVQDNGIGFDQSSLTELNRLLAEDIPTDINATFNEAKGLGIINIHNKIRLYEGNGYGLSIDSSTSRTVVTLHLNRYQKEK